MKLFKGYYQIIDSIIVIIIVFGIVRPNSDGRLCHMIDSCKIFAWLKELGPIKIKPTLNSFSACWVLF